MFARNADADRPDCGIMGCEEPARARGLCSACYSYWRAHRNQTAAQARVYIYRAKRITARIPVLIGVRKSVDPHWGAAAEEPNKSNGRQSDRESKSRPKPPLEARILDSGIVPHASSKRHAS